jgi:meiotic recombination protein SPO11
LIDTSLVRWILVIEKEVTDYSYTSNISARLTLAQATFRSLLSSPQWGTLGLECLALTVWQSPSVVASILIVYQAKGYPDLASRKFLRRIADHSPFTPMFALVDFDPDGIAIMSTYKHGSCRLAHENVTTGGTPTLSLPQLRWLGVQGHQLRQSLLMERSTGDGTVDSAQGVLRLTARDRTKACRMLEWDMCAEDGPEPECRRGLQTMLMLNIKAEMQILEELPGGLPKWLARELGAKQGGEADAEGMSITSGQHWLR